MSDSGRHRTVAVNEGGGQPLFGGIPHDQPAVIDAKCVTARTPGKRTEVGHRPAAVNEGMILIDVFV